MVRTTNEFITLLRENSSIFVTNEEITEIRDELLAARDVTIGKADEASASATAAQLSEWIAKAEELTAASYAKEAEDVHVKSYTSDGDGTYTVVDTLDYSALHWAAKSGTVEDVMKYVDTIASLTGLNTALHATVVVRGYYAPHDGGGGVFSYDASQAAVNNGGTIINGWTRQYSGEVNPRWFGAKCDGTTADNTVISAIATLFGKVVFFNNTALNTIILDVPIYFMPSGNITSLAGQTVTISHSIDAPSQWIFQGTGAYAIGHDTDSGEQARELHVSWFGAFPNPSFGADQAPMINKAFSSVGNGRESVIKFDIGNYRIASAISVTRGGHVLGAGIRRTVFNVSVDGFDVFDTLGEACKFSDLQFELSSITDRISGGLIKLSHNNCEIKNVVTSMSSKKHIIVNGNNCVTKDVICLISANTDADSSIVELNGSNCSVEDILLQGNADSAQAVVSVGGGGLGPISGFTLQNINSTAPSTVVKIVSKGGNITRGIMNNIRNNSYSGTPPSEAILIENAVASYLIEHITIDGVYSSANVTNGITISQTSTGTTKDIVINNINYGLPGYGVGLIRTAGNLNEVFIGTGNIGDCGTPIYKSGLLNNIRVSALTRFPLVNPSVSYDVTINDDDVYVIDLETDIYTGSVIVTAGYEKYGLFSIRAADVPGNIGMVLSANMIAATGVLTGITGVDGNVTVSADNDGKIYVENRSGAAQRTCITVNAGII